ncbi:protein phosphatase 2C domain-containing protein [Streptomyces sp. NPDC046862]|uniref:protein phosphatase 2C domain-containing protein n=1 Tax=Streptomyces sp. NPDC046862 TaxID=3154603 RepID=UPI0034546A46
MSQQGERPTGHEDDWWGQLYDDSTEDTGPAAAADSLDDRFASAADTVGQDPAARPESSPSGAPPPRGGPPTVPGRRTATPPDDARPAPADIQPRPAAGYAGYAGSDPADVSGRPGGPDGRSASDGRSGTPGPRNPPDRSGPAGQGSRSDPDSLVRRSAPWGAPPVDPSGPAAFPPGPKPPGFRAEAPPAGPARNAAPDGPVPTGAPDGPAPPDVPDGWARTGAPDGPVPTRAPDGPVPTRAPDGPAPTGAPDGRARTGAPVGPTRNAAPDAPASTGASDTPVPATLQSRDATLVTRSEPAAVAYVGSGPPTYDAEPTALPVADPEDLRDLVADTVLDGARYGACTLRAASVRGDSARFRGEPRRDSLLTARFGSGEEALVLVAMATGARATPGAHRAAAEACAWIGRAVGRSHVRLAEDMRAARRGELKSGLHRLTDRTLGKLRASAAEQGVEPEEYTAGLRCLLLPADPECRTRVFFGVGVGGLFRLRDGEWQDIEPRVAATAGAPVVGFGSLPHETPEGDRLTMDLGIATPPSPYEPAPAPPQEPFRFRASVARPGDTLLLCTAGLADPLRGEPQLAEHLTARWATGEPPGLAAFLTDTQVRVKGYADDRTAAAVWEA